MKTIQKWGTRPVPRIGLDRRNFKNLDYQGSVPTNSRMSNTDVCFERKLVKYYDKSPASTALINLCGDEFAIVKPNRSMVEKVMASWDAQPPFATNIPHFEKGLAHFNRYYKQIMSGCKADREQVLDWIDLTRSPGYPGIYFKHRTKRDCYTDPAYLKFVEEFNFLEPAYHWVKPKEEVLPMANILAGKCRLFVIPELLLCDKQLEFGKLISLRMKGFRWSAYGFNPYSGGTNKLAHRLLSKRYRFFYDISGWDKYLRLLPHIYKILKKHSGYASWTEREQREFDWMVDNTVDMFCVMYDGSVYRKPYGNGSGSGTTTRDNIFAHVIIMATMLYAAYHDKFGKCPSSAQVEEQIINLFGDDSVCAVDEDFDHITAEFAARIFGMFGMTLKFFYGGLDYPIEEMEFLGFKFKDIGNKQFVPLYNEKRLAAGLMYEGVNSNSRESILSKTFVLVFMSFPCASHKLFLQYGQDLASHFQLLGGLSQTEKIMCDLMLTMSPEELTCTFLGLEGSFRPEILQFFYSGMEEVGIKDLSPDAVENQNS